MYKCILGGGGQVHNHILFVCILKLYLIWTINLQEIIN